MVDIRIRPYPYPNEPPESIIIPEVYQTIAQLICTVYMQVAANGIPVHPLYKDTFSDYIYKARRASETTDDEIVKEALDTLLSYATSGSGYISLRPIMIALMRHPSCLPVEFYQPFILTLNNLQYAGKATRPYILYNGNEIIFNFTSSEFDNTSYLINAPSENLVSANKFWTYMASFDMGKQTFDLIVNTLAGNRVPSGSYTGPIRFTELCARAMMDVQTKNIGVKDKLYCIDRPGVMSLLVKLIPSGCLHLETSIYFPLLAEYISIGPDALKYITSKGSITIGERDAFKDSWLCEYPVRAAIASTEALAKDKDEDEEDEDDDKEESDDEEETSDDESTDDDKEESDDEEETSDDESTDDDKEEDDDGEPDGEEDVPKDDFNLTDTNFIELELSKDESMLDILYKEHVCEMVSSYRNDPPTDMSTEELLLLEIWCARWIFLVSAQTTRCLFSALAITVG